MLFSFTHTVIVDSVIGLEASLYEVGEGDQFAEVCAAILVPGDPSTLDSAFQANFNLSTSPGSAVGGRAMLKNLMFLFVKPL